jgi:hypothetical protein
MDKAVGQASINLKLTDDLKEKIKNRAGFRKQTISKYIRDLLSDYFVGTLCEREIEKNHRYEFVNSTEFLQLVVWMYSKKRSNKFIEKESEIENYIRTLKKIDDHLPKIIVDEFDKVLSDILRLNNLQSIYSKEFKFADGYSSSPEFNFEMLEKYILAFGKPLIVTSMEGLNLKKKL